MVSIWSHWVDIHNLYNKAHNRKGSHILSKYTSQYGGLLGRNITWLQSTSYHYEIAYHLGILSVWSSFQCGHPFSVGILSVCHMLKTLAVMYLSATFSFLRSGSVAVGITITWERYFWVGGCCRFQQAHAIHNDIFAVVFAILSHTCNEEWSSN